MNGGEVNATTAFMLKFSHVRLSLLIDPWRVPDDEHGVVIKLHTISFSSIQKGALEPDGWERSSKCFDFFTERA